MEFEMTHEEWELYKQQREASYGVVMINKRLPPKEQDVFEWLAENETEEEKAEYASIMKMCAGA